MKATDRLPTAATLPTGLLADIPAERPVSLEREIFPRWLEKWLYGYRSYSPFIDIGTPEDFAAAQDLIPRLVNRPAPPQSDRHGLQEGGPWTTQ